MERDVEQIVYGPHELLQNEWALVGVGNKDNYNAMTIAWGGFGDIWRIPVAILFIEKDRYSLEFLDNNKYFTLSFFSEDYKEDLIFLGTNSGRDMDKISKTKLTPVLTDECISFKEARKTYLCEKIYFQDLDKERTPQEVYDKYYDGIPTHRMYFGKIVKEL